MYFLCKYLLIGTPTSKLVYIDRYTPYVQRVIGIPKVRFFFFHFPLPRGKYFEVFVHIEYDEMAQGLYLVGSFKSRYSYFCYFLDVIFRSAYNYRKIMEH